MFDLCDIFVPNSGTSFLLPIGIVGVSSLIVLLSSLVYRKYLTPSIASTDNLPWAGLRNEVFSKTRASLRQWKNSIQTLAEGYTQFGRNGSAFTVPSISFKSPVLLPQEHIQWLVAQPESILSVRKVQEENHALKYMNNSIEHKVTVKFLDNVVGRCLTKRLHSTQADMYDEIRASVDDTLGLDEDWHDVTLQKMTKMVADRAGSRTLFGLALCRDQAYLHNTNGFNMLMGVGTVIVGQIPWLIRPLIGAIVGLPLRIYKARTLRILVPLIKARMQEYAQKGHSGLPKDESNDFVTQAVKVAMESKGSMIFDDPDILAEQFLLLAFAALSTSALVGTIVFVDILAVPSEISIYSTLREEAAKTFQSESDWSDPAAIRKLVLIDSAIRESLRIYPLASSGLLREVIPEDGLLLPSGERVARGTWIGAPVHAVHMDDRFYNSPDRYDPFRFARMDDRVDATQSSDTFMRWGHGRSACPGRWFATQLQKLMIAYVTINYDIKPLEKRPKNMVFGDNIWPMQSAHIRVRRRKHD